VTASSSKRADVGHVQLVAAVRARFGDEVVVAGLLAPELRETQVQLG
jgi:hypothetical protein